MARGNRPLRALALSLSAGLVLASPGVGAYSAFAAEIAPEQAPSIEGSAPSLSVPDLVSQAQGMMFNGIDAGSLLEGLSGPQALSPELSELLAPVRSAGGAAAMSVEGRRALQALASKARKERWQADEILSSEQETIGKRNAAGLEKALSRIRPYMALLQASQRVKIEALEKRLNQYKEERAQVGIDQAAAAWGARAALEKGISIGAISPAVTLAPLSAGSKLSPGRLAIGGADRTALGAALLKLNAPTAPIYPRSGGALLDFKSAEEAAKAALALVGLGVASSATLHPDAMAYLPQTSASQSLGSAVVPTATVSPILKSDRVASNENISGNRIDARFDSQEALARWGGTNANGPHLYFFLPSREAAVKKALELLDDPHLTRLETSVALALFIKRRLPSAPSAPMPISEKLLSRLRIRTGMAEEKSVNVHFVDPLSGDAMRSFLKLLGVAGALSISDGEHAVTPGLFPSLEEAAEKTIDLLRQEEIAYIRVAKSLADFIAEYLKANSATPPRSEREPVPGLNDSGGVVELAPPGGAFNWTAQRPPQGMALITWQESDRVPERVLYDNLHRSGLSRDAELAAGRGYREVKDFLQSVVARDAPSSVGLGVGFGWRFDGQGGFIMFDASNLPNEQLRFSEQDVNRLKEVFSRTVVGGDFRTVGGRIFYRPENPVAIWIIIPANEAGGGDSVRPVPAVNSSEQEISGGAPPRPEAGSTLEPAALDWESKISAFDPALHASAAEGRLYVSVAPGTDVRAAMRTALAAAGFAGVPVMAARAGSPASYQAFVTLSGTREAARLARILAASEAFSAVAVHPVVLARIGSADEEPQGAPLSAASRPRTEPETGVNSLPALDGTNGGLKEFLLRLLGQQDIRSPGVRYAAAETLALAAPEDAEWARGILSSNEKLSALHRYYPEVVAAAGILARSGGGAEDTGLITEAIRRAQDGSLGGDNYNPLRLALAESLSVLLKPETREDEVELLSRYTAVRNERTTEKEALFRAAARWGGEEFKDMLLADWAKVTGAAYAISVGIAQADRAKLLYRYLKRVDPGSLEALLSAWRARGSWDAPPSPTADEKREEALALYAAADSGSQENTEADAKRMRDMIDGFSSAETHSFYGAAAGEALEHLLAARRIYAGSRDDLRRHLGHYLAVHNSINAAKLIMLLSAISASKEAEDEAMVFQILDGVSFGYGELAQHEAARAWAKMAVRSGRIREYLQENETDENGRPISKIEKMLTDARPFINKAALEAVKFYLQYQAASRPRRRRSYP